MGLRFWRRFKILPGVTLNLSRSWPSVSFGPRGAKLTVGPRGTRVTVGLPGTGLHYTVAGKKAPDGEPRRRVPGTARVPHVHHETDAQSSRALSEAGADSSGDQQADPVADDVLLAAAADIEAGMELEALERLRTIVYVPDAAFLAGIVALRIGAEPEEAAALLRHAARDENRLGTTLAGLGLDLSLTIPISDEVQVVLRPDRRGATLALVEALQRIGRVDEGIGLLRELLVAYPGDPLIELSLADLLEGTDSG